MGCTPSKYSSGESDRGDIVKFDYRSLASDSELLDPAYSKGTTIIALFYKWGVIVGVDSRSSNEWQYQYPLKIKDDNDKTFRISDNIFAISTGAVVDCYNLRAYVNTQCSLREKGKISVPDLSHMAWTHLNDLPEEDKENKVFGVLIVGWDEYNGVKVYRVYIRDGQIHNELVKSESLFTSLGSGSIHAIKIMNQLVRENERCKRIRSLDALVVENPIVCSPSDSELYTLGEYEPRVLFLVYSTIFAPIRASQLIDLFREQGGEAIAAHLVRSEEARLLLSSSGVRV
ncbi:hypothetical protein ACLB2K_012162 [Fragaria x ananassa]